MKRTFAAAIFALLAVTAPAYALHDNDGIRTDQFCEAMEKLVLF